MAREPYVVVIRLARVTRNQRSMFFGDSTDWQHEKCTTIRDLRYGAAFLYMCNKLPSSPPPKKNLESQMISPLFTAFYLKKRKKASVWLPSETEAMFDHPNVQNQPRETKRQASGAVGHLSQVSVPFVTSQRTDFQRQMVAGEVKTGPGCRIWLDL